MVVLAAPQPRLCHSCSIGRGSKSYNRQEASLTRAGEIVNEVESTHLWPEAFMETTFGRRKSHLRSGYRKGTTKPPEAPSTWILMSQPFFLFSSPATV